MSKMSGKSIFGDDVDSDLDDQELPFPKPLDRGAFLEPDFDPATFLSSLTSRFQTLDDLQVELRDLVQSLNKELINLVNDNYQDFLSLGTTLAGGEEKLDEVRVGLLGFERDVQLVRDQVARRSEEVRTTLDRKRALRKDIFTCHKLLEIAERTDALEERLGIARPVQPPQRGLELSNSFEDWREGWDDTLLDDYDQDDDVDDSVGIPARLQRHVDQYLMLKLLRSKFSAHSFPAVQQSKLVRINDRLRHDLETAARHQTELKIKQKIIQLRAQLDE